jgi:hypothetical protein
MSSPTNPYDCARPIRDPQDFYGRSRQVQTIFELIGKGGCANVVGERRSGKTSLLLHVLHPEVQRQYMPHDQQGVCVYLDAEICPQEPEGFFRDVFVKAKAQHPDLDISLDKGKVDYGRARALLEAISPRRLVVFIDEFENIAQCENFPPYFFVFLRGLCNCYPLSLVIASCRRLVECCPHEVVTSPFPNIFTTVELGSFTREELEDFLLRSSVPSGIPLWEMHDEIVNMAGHYPYLLQMACRHCFAVWEERGALDPDARGVIRRRFEDEARPYFESVWRRHLSKEEHETCIQLVQGKECSRPNVVWRLEQKGYILGGRVASDVFAEIIRQQSLPSAEGTGPVPEPPPAGIRVDAVSGNAYVDGKLISPPLTAHQFSLLRLLYENRGSICDFDTIIKAVFGQEYMEVVDDQRIAQLVSRLRKRVEPDGRPWRYIRTVHGRGLTLGNGDLRDNPENP